MTGDEQPARRWRRLRKVGGPVQFWTVTGQPIPILPDLEAVIRAASDDDRPRVDDDYFDSVISPITGRPMYFDKAGQPISMNRWGELRCVDEALEPGGYARVGSDKVGKIHVSTVWMGINHRFGPGEPLIFETMLFGYDDGDELDSPLTRYCTEQEAIEGHRWTVDDLRAGRAPWFLRGDD